jgi:hypothetical protein
MKIIKNDEIISPNTCIECPFFSIQNRRNGRGVCGVYAAPVYQGGFCNKGIVIKYDDCFFNCNDCVHYDWYSGICRYRKEMFEILSDMKHNCAGFQMRSEESRKSFNPPTEAEQKAYYDKHPEEKVEDDRIREENYMYKQRPESEFPAVFVFGAYIKNDEIGMYAKLPEIFSRELQSVTAKITIIKRVYSLNDNRRNVDFIGKIELSENGYIIRIDGDLFAGASIRAENPITVSVCRLSE